MQTLEFTAKTVQEATQTAAQKLNVAPERVRVTVLEETKGLFGKSSVRVRAEVIEEAAAPAPAVAPVAATPTPTETLQDVQGAVDSSAPKPAPKGRSRRPKKEAEPEAAPAPDDGPVAAVEPTPVATAAEPESEEGYVASGDDAETVAEIVRELLEAASVQVTAKVGGINGKYVSIVLDGKDVAFIVGKHGEVLNALQYLVNIVIGRRLERQVRVTLDGNDYRRRREEALTQLASKIAAQVKERGEEAVLDALPAFERRIVHKALSEIDGVTTYSEGEEPNRRVVIAPAD
ncbi:MAG: RNA-binding cell elongation regulator Jag/EloR [Fimbriimonas sp.]